MLVRSPRRFAILSFLSLVFIFAVFQQSPWAQEKVYERLPLFDLVRTPANQELLPLESQDDAQAHFDDAWNHAVPAAKPIPTSAQPVTSAVKVLPPPMVSSHQPTPAPETTKSYPPWVTAPSRTGSFIPPTPRPSNMTGYMEKMLNWARPSWDGHWPPFGDYVNKAYDPNRWENFDM
jgi:hypothetical protein